MDINENDYDIININDKEVICIKFIVKKIIQNKNYILYEGIGTNKKIEKFYSIKNNNNGYNGKLFKFKLTNGKEEIIKGPWYDFSNPIH